MSPINIPPEGKGSITLRGYCFINGSYRECLIIEASSLTQSAKVQIIGSLFVRDVTFQNIANIALKYDDGTIAQNFGAPRTNRPESIEFISSVFYQEFDEYSDADSGL